jgi:hypothetical protein
MGDKSPKNKEARKPKSTKQKKDSPATPAPAPKR